MIAVWLIGLIRTRTGRVVGSLAGIAIAVALLVDLGLFLDQSSASMTARAVRAVTTDWQIELVAGVDAAAVSDQIQAAAKVTANDTVGYASVDGFEATTGTTVQTTGAGRAVGLPIGYFDRHAGDVRLLSGDLGGTVLLQQTAANLHVQLGDTITLKRPGAPDARVQVAGIIDLKSADSFFQAIGVPPGAAPRAPPDNAVFMLIQAWTEIFAAQATARPDTVRTQLHVALDHATLPVDPNEAFAFASSQGRNLEARLAGSAMLSNNLAAQLDATRGDALYARVLFLFLGAPGAILAALLTFSIAMSDGQTRQRDLALLKLRGATPSRAMRYAAAEATMLGIAGSALGLAVGIVVATALAGLTIAPRSFVWLVAGALAGMVLAGTAILGPALLSARTQSFAAGRQPAIRRATPLWMRLYTDLICLALAGLVFWRTAATGYQVVLATEGVTATAVDYAAFLAPVLLWIGAGLLSIRLSRLILHRGRPVIEAAVSPLAGSVAPAVSTALSRQRARISIGVALTGLAVAFLTSTAIFNATYEAQARVDAQLTNGADVTVTGSTATPAGAIIAQLRQLPGVVDAEPMQHRYAYVGTDLQDLYGIDPSRLGKATNLSNAFFANGDAAATLKLLASRPDAILVSEETVSDFQLSPGDTINLRLQGSDRAYHVVPFIFSGVVREFPTAPRDSFLVANASYIAKLTGSEAAEIVLTRTAVDPETVKRSAADLATPMGLDATSLQDAVHIIGSSLTAVDLAGLSRIELGFAVLLAIGATALVLAIGFADRRRDFAILKVLGADRRVLSSFVWAEGGFVVIAGTLLGATTGALVAQVLVKVLEGVFDPPPETLSVPWSYVVAALAAIAIASSVAVVNAARQAAKDPLLRIREQG